MVATALALVELPWPRGHSRAGVRPRDRRQPRVVDRRLLAAAELAAEPDGDVYDDLASIPMFDEDVEYGLRSTLRADRGG